MALTETLTETLIATKALDRIGANKTDLSDIETDTTIEAKSIRNIYVQTRNALIRSHWWRFASGRLALVKSWVTSTVYTTDQYVFESSTLYKCAIDHTSGTFADDLVAVDWVEITARPQFQWTYAYDLPVDFLRAKAKYKATISYAIEGSQLLTDDTDVEILYIRRITDPTAFDPLFVELLVLNLALKVIMPLAQDKALQRELWDERAVLMRQVRTIDKQEQNTMGRANRATWNGSRRISYGASSTINLSGIPDAGS